MKPLYRALLCLPVLVFSLAFVGCGDSDSSSDSRLIGTDETPTSSGELYALGDTVELGDHTVTVFGTSEHTTDVTGYLDADEGNKYVAVEVSYENRTDGESISYNLFDWTTYDADGYEYSPSFVDAKEPGLSSGDLNPGAKVRGWITFEIPAAATLERMKFTPDLFSSKNVEFKLQ